MTLNTYFTIVAAVLGGCWGSFLNAAYYRINNQISLSSPPSHCPKCKKNIPIYLNLPVIGWLLSGGKCFNCRLPISFHYPAIEALTAALFAGCYIMTHNPWAAGCLGVLISLYALGTIYDHHRFVLPDLTLYGAILFAVTLAYMAPTSINPATAGFEFQILGGAFMVALLLVIKHVGELFFRRTVPFGGVGIVNERGVQLYYKDGTDELTTWEEFCFAKVLPQGGLKVSDKFEAENAQQAFKAIKAEGVSDLKDGDFVIYDGAIEVGTVKLPLKPGMLFTSETLRICRNAMGSGDIWLVASLGTLIGFNIGLFDMFLLACVTGTIHGLWLKRTDGRLPFGPHLIAATAYVIASRYGVVPAIWPMFQPGHFN